MPKVVVLRLGHRPQHDRRLSTHVGLTARALGADGLILADVGDKRVEETLHKVVRNWGGDFFVHTRVPWRRAVKEWRSNGGIVVHLTMHGDPVDGIVPKIRGKDVLVVVGAEKVPREIYGLADFNVAIGNQPHSEVSALAIFLDRFFGGSELKKKFPGAKLAIPQRCQRLNCSPQADHHHRAKRFRAAPRNIGQKGE